MLTFNFAPFPTLATPRLHLRPLTNADAPALFTMRSDPEVMRYIPSLRATSVADVVALIERMNGLTRENQGLTWSLALHHDPTLIGTIGYYRVQPENHRAEIGYLLHPAHQGKGLMHEALAAVLDYGFRVLAFHSVEGVIDPRNGPSAQVLLRAGFVQEGLFRESVYWDGQFSDTAYYSLLQADWHGSTS